MKRYQRWFAAALGVIVLVGLFSLDPVRGLAAEMLQVFRVNQVQVLRFDPAEVQQLENALRGSGQKVSLDSFGTFSNETIEDSNIIDANTAAVDGKRIAIPEAIGAYKRTGDLHLSQGMKLLATPKVVAINSFLAGLGSKSPLPDSLDGKTFTVQIAGCVGATFTKPGATDSLTLRRSLSPVLTVPAGVDVEQVRKALLDIPILPEGMRDTLAGVNINGGTLLIPDFGAGSHGGSVEDVNVNGNPGVMVTPPRLSSEAGSKVAAEGNMLIWVKDGVWNCLSGNFTRDQALTLAASID